MNKIKGRALSFLALVVLTLSVFLVWSNFQAKSQQAIPEIRLGDGVNGPKGMA